MKQHKIHNPSGYLLTVIDCSGVLGQTEFLTGDARLHRQPTSPCPAIVYTATRISTDWDLAYGISCHPEQLQLHMATKTNDSGVPSQSVFSLCFKNAMPQALEKFPESIVPSGRYAGQNAKERPLLCHVQPHRNRLPPALKPHLVMRQPWVLLIHVVVHKTPPCSSIVVLIGYRQTEVAVADVKIPPYQPLYPLFSLLPPPPSCLLSPFRQSPLSLKENGKTK
ncbi:hypothetical protein B0T16DRAFT_180697 [Cercophora newfieldiana]|uniref:Uncharacterized protein n=1 Tax=Cercophora newfieldiana TaxID=92897 RepID=A0AA39XZW5_9PEZI|nr:hypothetical protein B0T16DRAFT_180697 [Cercophora newfieldiana]